VRFSKVRAKKKKTKNEFWGRAGKKQNQGWTERGHLDRKGVWVHPVGGRKNTQSNERKKKLAQPKGNA